MSMLVLSRKKDERIIIGDAIKVMVVEIRGDKVRLGIDAPREIDIHREEIWLEIQHERRAVAAAIPPAQEVTGHAALH